MDDIIRTNFGYRGYKYIKTEHNIIFMRDNDNIVLVFNNNDILNMVNIKDYISIANTLNIKHIIIVYKNKITPSTKKIMKHCEIEIEIFEQDDISYDLTKHKYYFPHIKVDDVTKKELLDKYGNNLPIILKNDKIVTFFNFKKGDVLKILRKDNNIYYRIVK